MLYKGSQFECPLCQGRFSRFVSSGIPPRANAKCPKCDSRERDRLLCLYLKNKTKIFLDELRVLHFAPERCIQKLLRSLPNIEYISADLESALALVKTDITEMSFEDHTFDVVICNHVLEHIPDDHQAMKELYRVLKPGGWAIIQAPVRPGMEKTFEDPEADTPEKRLQAYDQADHFRTYGRDYKDRLAKAGFTVKVDKYVKELPKETVEKHSLMLLENIYFCTKP
ncbi:MAG: methyltransferase domain-containing protein [Planctomycetes bacterium]|nr:methyltransferase domain-containing protein [Planctomycetota bacterium]